MSVKHSRESRLVEALIEFDRARLTVDSQPTPDKNAKSDLAGAEVRLISFIRGHRPPVWKDGVYLLRRDGRGVERLDVQLLF